jgi:hypothetical protein
LLFSKHHASQGFLRMTICSRHQVFFRAGGWGVLFLAGSLAMVSLAQEGRMPQIARSTGKDKTKLREGSRLIDRAGSFSDRGGRYFFSAEGESEPFTLLENQTLERVTSASSNQDDNAKWTVTGVITEFKDGRFLLLERAVLGPRKASEAGNR